MNFPCKPFNVPNFVTLDGPIRPRKNGFTLLPTMPLSEVPVEELGQMCDDFRKEIFRKACKADPKAGRK